MWITWFEVYEDKLVAEFCPPSEESTLLISILLFGSLDSWSGCAGGDVGSQYSEEDEKSDYESCQSETCLNFGSELLTPAVCWAWDATAFD